MELTLEQINAIDAAIDPGASGAAIAEEAIGVLKATLCSSHNHHRCYGELWRCSGCGKVTCCVEGDSDGDLCDTCWSQQPQAGQDAK